MISSAIWKFYRILQTNPKEEATAIVPVFNIDSIKECEEATFIKMDIEGCEMDALQGAKNTIMRNHPN